MAWRASSWVILFVIWAAIGAMLTLELLLTLKPMHPEISIGSVAFGQFMRVFLWASLTPLVFWCQRTFPITRRTWLWTIPLHLVLSVVAMVFIYLTRLFIAFVYYDEALVGFWSRVVSEFYGRNLIDIPIYWTVLGAGYTVGIAERFREAQIRSARLENDLAQAEMKALKAQLHPHFLFNTLNTISVLVREEQNKEAVSLIARLSSLLRFALETTGQQEVPLRQEIEFLRRYLDIQSVRFSDRLKVTFDLDPAALDAMVPNLILQPLVENAVIHGFSQQSSSGRIEIRAMIQSDRLRLSVSDDGPGFASKTASNGKGIGLANSRERLARMFDNRASLFCSNRPQGGAEVVVDMPVRWHANSMEEVS